MNPDGTRKQHVNVLFKGAEATPQGPEGRKHGIHVTWKGAHVEPREEGSSDRKGHHIGISWKSLATEQGSDSEQGSDRKHHVTFTWRAAPGADYSNEVGPDGRIHYVFTLRNANSSDSSTDKRFPWSFFGSMLGSAFSRDSPAEARKHHITFSWREGGSLADPVVSTDAGSAVAPDAQAQSTQEEQASQTEAASST